MKFNLLKSEKIEALKHLKRGRTDLFPVLGRPAPTVSIPSKLIPEMTDKLSDIS